MSRPTIDEIKAAFFDALLHGWIGQGSPQPIQGLPGFKGFDIMSGSLRVIDAWCSGEDGFSAGFTTISRPEDEIWIPVWNMTYQGRYDEEAMRIVKMALRKSYKAGDFHGGRGPAKLESWGMTYKNEVGVVGGNEFYRFKGHESVRCVDEPLGFHVYSGGTLFSCKKG